MAIIISKNGKNAEKLDQSVFGLEDKLQEYIYDNPDTIPLYEIDEDTRLFIAAREFSTKSGPIDALGFDARGNIYVVETKLYKNPDKRTVVAQALDYGASLWRHATDFDAFTLQLDSHTQKQFGMGFTEKFQEFFGLDESTDYMQAIHSNLADGSIKFVVLMDRLQDALKDLVVFVNQNSKFDLYAVELEYYKHQEFEIVIPKLFGAEVKKEVTSTKPKTSGKYMTPATEDDFLQYAVMHFENGELSEIGRDAVIQLHNLFIELTKKTNGTNTYWRAQTDFRDVIKLIVNDTQNKVSLYLDSDSSFGAYPGGKTGPQIDYANEVLHAMIEGHLLKRTEKHLAGSQWFTGFKTDKASDDEITKFLAVCAEKLQEVI